MGKKWRTRKIKNRNKSKSGKRAKTMRKKYIQKGGLIDSQIIQELPQTVNPNAVEKVASPDTVELPETVNLDKIDKVESYDAVDLSDNKNNDINLTAKYLENILDVLNKKNI